MRRRRRHTGSFRKPSVMPAGSTSRYTTSVGAKVSAEYGANNARQNDIDRHLGAFHPHRYCVPCNRTRSSLTSSELARIMRPPSPPRAALSGNGTTPRCTAPSSSWTRRTIHGWMRQRQCSMRPSPTFVSEESLFWCSRTSRTLRAPCPLTPWLLASVLSGAVRPSRTPKEERHHQAARCRNNST